MAKRKNKDAAVVSINSEHRKNIAKCIDFIGRVHSPWTVFSDFLAIAAITISNNSDPCYIATSKKVRDEREKRYLDIINQYDKREQKLLISMFNELVEELQSYCNGGESIHLTDVLGELFHELDFNDKWKGQFFTPQHICDLMGETAIGENGSFKTEIKEKGYFTVLEPCCGGGAMIYGVANAMFEAGMNFNKDALFFANDIDERCIFMTYIQCSLYGIPAIVQQKNSLTNQILSPPWFTPVFVWHSWRWNDLWKESAKK